MSAPAVAAADHYDLVIIGGGPVGASLACALAEQPLRIAVVEAVGFEAAGQPSYDDRAIALAAGTRRIFEALEVWPALSPEVSPIHRIHVSDRGHFGFTRIDRSQQGVPALGYVTPARALGAALGTRVGALPAVDLICPARVERVGVTGPRATVALTENGRFRELTTGLVVAADGARSAVREQLGIGTREWNYGQTALITNITPQHDHGQVAFERFTDSGPLAILPLGPRRCAAVWTLQDAEVEAVLALDDAGFLKRLQERFGFRLGRLEHAGARHAYPLRLVRAAESVGARLAVIGNAAHTLHPIAGQGFNLGLRDVAALAQVIAEAREGGEDIGDLPVLERYARWRRADHRRVIGFTDGLARLFVNPLPPVRAVGDAGMVALDLLPPAKRLFARLTMGRAGRLPRLACGVPLARPGEGGRRGR